MSTCSNCGTEIPDTEQGKPGIVANIGFLLVAKSPWWPNPVCKKCVRQVRLFGQVSLAIVALLLAALFIARWR